MSRHFNRLSAEGYCLGLLSINGESDEVIRTLDARLINISKGGFCFQVCRTLELEDRITVMLTFPDGHAQEVYGRISYCEDSEKSGSPMTFGFSVLRGFYRLEAVA